MNIVKGLNFCKPKFVFVPFDIIADGSSIGYEVQFQVKIEGSGKFYIPDFKPLKLRMSGFLIWFKELAD